MNTGVPPLSDAALRRHRAQVFQFLRRRIDSDELADDLTQEVFERAAAHLGSLDDSRPLLAWLYRVASNRLIDEIRRRQRRPQVVVLDEEDAPAAPVEFGPELGAAIRRASLRLPECDRKILGLRLFAGCSFAETAAQLKITEAAAKMRYLRALRTLCAELEQEGVSNA